MREQTPIGVQVGVSEKAIEATVAGIIAILNSGQEQETLRAALETMRHATSVNNTTITSCNFELGWAGKEGE